MIINMAGGSANVQCMHFALSLIVIGPNNLVINNVHIPGGVMKGFVLLQDSTGIDEMQNNKYIFAYANEEMTKANEMEIGIYLSQYGGIFKYNWTNYFAYDQQAQTLTIIANGNDFYWDAGRYTLFVW